MSRFKSWLIALSDSKWKPSLFAFWVDSFRKTIVGINLGKNIGSNSITLNGEPFKENDLQVTVIIIKVSKVIWRRSTSKCNIIICKLLCLFGGLSAEIKDYWRKSWLVNPSIPVDLTEDLVDLGSIVIFIFNIFFKGESEIISSQGGLSIVKNVLTEHLLEVIWADESLKVIQKLEALLIRNG